MNQRLQQIRAGNDDRWMNYYVDGELWALDETNGLPFAGISSLFEWCRDEVKAQGFDMTPQEMFDDVLAGNREERMSELHDWIVERYEEQGHGGLVIEVPIIILKCLRCGNEWVQRGAHRPRTCANPKCRSPYWDRPRIRGGIHALTL